VKLSVGVDIGSTEVRVAAVTGIDIHGYAAVARSGIVPLREGAVQGGKVRNATFVSQAIVRALEMAGVPRYGFILGYGGPDIALGRMELPAAIKPEERVGALRTMDRSISPVMPLPQSVLVTNEIAINYTTEGVAEALLVAAAMPKETLADLRDLMKLAGCEAKAIDLSAAGLMRALVRVDPASNDVQTIVDIGETTTTVATRQGPYLRSVRVIAKGGTLITRAIMTQTEEDAVHSLDVRRLLNLTKDQESTPIELAPGYGTRVMDVPTPNVSVSAFDEAINRAVQDLLEDIASAISQDATANNNSLTQGVVVLGRTAQIEGMKTLLSQRLGVPVTIGRPWARLERSRYNLPYLIDAEGEDESTRKARATEHLMRLSTAIGLALWRPTT
jgi:Tfp pilus assembly PilM family ATPase